VLTQTAPTRLHQEFDHELVEVFRDPETGLTGAIAVHSTARGPAMGGLRLHAYDDLSDLVADALRLGRAMTLKNATAGLELGGGKAVLLDDGRWEGRRAERLHAFGAILERLGGRYITAEDVGTTPADMAEIASVTRWVAGLPEDAGGWGNPSRATARTVFGAVRAGVRQAFGSDDLAGVSVGVLGVGNVGSRLAELLAEAGAEVVVADVNESRAAAVATRCGGRTAPVDGFIHAPVEVLAPCALGEVIDHDDVDELRARVIAGSANNPLVDDSVARALDTAGVLYVPDFVANCGGIIFVGAEALGLDQSEVERRIEAAVERIDGVLLEAAACGRLPLEVAYDRAQAALSVR
jgi:leucine dehydrogenase